MSLADNNVNTKIEKKLLKHCYYLVLFIYVELCNQYKYWLSLRQC